MKPNLWVRSIGMILLVLWQSFSPMLKVQANAAATSSTIPQPSEVSAPAALPVGVKSILLDNLMTEANISALKNAYTGATPYTTWSGTAAAKTADFSDTMITSSRKDGATYVGGTSPWGWNKNGSFTGGNASYAANGSEGVQTIASSGSTSGTIQANLRTFLGSAASGSWKVMYRVIVDQRSGPANPYVSVYVKGTNGHMIEIGVAEGQNGQISVSAYDDTAGNYAAGNVNLGSYSIGTAYYVTLVYPGSASNKFMMCYATGASCTPTVEYTLNTALDTTFGDSQILLYNQVTGANGISKVSYSNVTASGAQTATVTSNTIQSQANYGYDKVWWSGSAGAGSNSISVDVIDASSGAVINSNVTNGQSLSGITPGRQIKLRANLVRQGANTYPSPSLTSWEVDEIDITGPTLGINTSPSYDLASHPWVGTAITVNPGIAPGGCVDNESGIKSAAVSIQRDTWQPSILITSPSSVRVRCTNNLDMTTENYIGDVLVDIDTPQSQLNLSGTLGNNDWYVSGVTVSEKGVDSSTVFMSPNGWMVQGTTKQIMWNGGPWMSSPMTFNIDGFYTVSTRIIDSQNRVAFSSGSFKIDKTPPTIDTNDPIVKDSHGKDIAKESYTNETNPTFSWNSASDPTPGSGLAGYDVCVQPSATSCSTPTDSTTNPSYLATATNSIWFSWRAVDKAGNVSAWTTPYALIKQIQFTPALDNDPGHLTVSWNGSGSYNVKESIACSNNAVTAWSSVTQTSQTSYTIKNPRTDGCNKINVSPLDGAGNPIGSFDSDWLSTNDWTFYYNFGGSPVALRNIDDNRPAPSDLKSNTYYMGTDQLGSVNVVMDGYGKIATETRYLPYGQAYWSSGSSPTDRGYTGQITTDFGLNDYNARFYDPYITQFSQPDPIIQDPYNPLAWNRYAYVQYNPINKNDPTGYFTEEQILDYYGVKSWKEVLALFDKNGAMEGKWGWLETLRQAQVGDRIYVNNPSAPGKDMVIGQFKVVGHGQDHHLALISDGILSDPKKTTLNSIEVANQYDHYGINRESDDGNYFFFETSATEKTNRLEFHPDNVDWVSAGLDTTSVAASFVGANPATNAAKVALKVGVGASTISAAKSLVVDQNPNSIILAAGGFIPGPVGGGFSLASLYYDFSNGFYYGP